MSAKYLIGLLCLMQGCACSVLIMAIGTRTKPDFWFRSGNGPLTLSVDCRQADDRWLTLWKISGTAKLPETTLADGKVVAFMGADKRITYGDTPDGMLTLVSPSPLPSAHLCEAVIHCVTSATNTCVGRTNFWVTDKILSCGSVKECERELMQQVTSLQ